MLTEAKLRIQTNSAAGSVLIANFISRTFFEYSFLHSSRGQLCKRSEQILKPLHIGTAIRVFYRIETLWFQPKILVNWMRISYLP